MPDHPAVRGHHGAPEPTDPVVTVERVAHQDPPEPPDELRPWLDGTWDDPDQGPGLRESLGEAEPRQRLDAAPGVRELHADWTSRWAEWAERERHDRPARTAYNELFSAYVTAAGHTEELELVIGVGCLSWSPPGHPVVRRHLATVPATIHFDDSTGQLAVHQAESADGITVELDMLDPGLVANPQHVVQIRAEARELTSAVLHRDVVGGALRRLVHALDSGAAYLDEDEPHRPGPHATAAFAPAVILRRRSRQGVVDILDAVAAQLSESGQVPDGLLPLVDPDHRPGTTPSPEQGALVDLDDEPFLPLPVNERQLRVLAQVDAKAQTLVQGPPGTGKTHTVAALLSHLLAQGKRVLVTAHTDRALKEVRAKLPKAIAPLAVSVVGSSRSDLADLKVAVEQISYMAGEHDAESSRQAIDDLLAAIDVLRRRRAEVYRRLLDARLREVASHEVGEYRGTLAAIAHRVDDERDRHGWAVDLVPEGIGPSPVSAPDLVAWHQALVDDGLIADEDESALRRPRLDELPDPEAVRELIAAERRAVEASEAHGHLAGHDAFDAVRGLEPSTRSSVRSRLNGFAREARELSKRREEWMNAALSDVLAGRANIWRARGQQVAQVIAAATPLVHRLGPLTDIRVAHQADLDRLASLAGALRAQLGDGGALKTNPDGTPKIGAFTPKVVKHSSALFQAVRVNGVPPTSAAHLDLFLTWAEAGRSLAALDRAWPDSVRVPAEDTLSERLQWHMTEHEQLRRVLALGQALEVEARDLAAIGLPQPNWTDLTAVQTYARLVDAAAASDARTAAAAPLAEVLRTLDDVAAWADAAPCVGDLAAAVLARDHEGYAAAHRRLTRLAEVAEAIRRRDAVSEVLATRLPALRSAVAADPRAPEWTARLADWTATWSWAVARTWVLGQSQENVNALQDEVLRIEEQVRDRVGQLAAERAWGHAVSPERLSGRARADLLQYAQLVRLLGRGTGMYADKRRADIKAAMARCRPAVPVWIMPIYRIAEQFRVQPDMFDVVIVDEASQAGLEATFLQYLAPKIVVIGDDKQVSPTAVGVDQQQLRDLAEQYLWDDPYRASWQDPKRSLFDEAKMRFEGMTTLIEHRRCVPEIIGFSNRVAYGPDGIRLVPVRQYGADRLEPIKPVFLEKGYERGVTDKVNPPEADAIVDQIEKCIADPRYDGLTFGVVSLLGRAQAKRIEKRLLERIPSDEWTARDLRCGDSADFQGSERDVMFLSMVKAAEPGRRIGALTQEMYVQRFNVAVSRAKDQLWVYHSVRPSDLGNTEDMRFQLLDHCYGQTADGVAGAMTSAVPDDRRVEPFDSLFEQRVFNRIVDRGYTVVPQFPAEGYRIDLVVMGGKTRLAVECDGDAWHGPDAYQRDLARQRDLERCGWQFFRIRESEFYADREAVLARLWDALREVDIHPPGWTTDQTRDREPQVVPGVATPEAVVIEPAPATVEPAPAIVELEPVEPRPSDHGRPAASLDTIALDGNRMDTLHLDPVPEETSALDPVKPEPSAAMLTLELVVDDGAEIGDEQVSETVVGLVLAEYAAFTGTVAQVGGASRDEVLRGLVQVVAVEGPVLGGRLHTAYVRGSGAVRVTKQVAADLNKTITQAVRRGLLVESDPLGEGGIKPRTYRLPDQPPVRIRHLGPRQFDEVPPGELAALLTQLAGPGQAVGDEALHRAALEALGLKRMTENVRKRFATVVGLLADRS
ncbi:AAA domain-containing protein [Actinokineospora guangxiensis]|uniref:AAA domain-containing protein n=1 Tax=Actinokineospora guangxiensis TaxID=1490288 RepID=A0ABW0EWZ2_9PSEU